VLVEVDVVSVVCFFCVDFVRVDEDFVVNNDSKRLPSQVVLFGCGAGLLLMLALSPVVKMLVWLLLIVVWPLFDGAVWLLTPIEMCSSLTVFTLLSSSLLFLFLPLFIVVMFSERVCEGFQLLTDKGSYVSTVWPWLLIIW